MVAFTFRMGAGFPGGVNRVHASRIEPELNDPTQPVLAYGQAAIYSGANSSVRAIQAADVAASAVITGISVRPFPVQQTSGGMSAAFGSAATQGANSVLDVLKSGYIMVAVSGGGAPTKGGLVYCWGAASTGSHVQGGFETAASAGNTLQVGSLPGTYWNGPADANGVAELAFNV